EFGRCRRQGVFCPPPPTSSGLLDGPQAPSRSPFFHPHAVLAPPSAAPAGPTRSRQQTVEPSRVHKKRALPSYRQPVRTVFRLLPASQATFPQALQEFASSPPTRVVEDKFAQRLPALLRDAAHFCWGYGPARRRHLLRPLSIAKIRRCFRRKCARSL